MKLLVLVIGDNVQQQLATFGGRLKDQFQVPVAGGEAFTRPYPNYRWDSYVMGGRYFKMVDASGKRMRAAQSRKDAIVEPIEPTKAVVKDGQWYEPKLWRFTGEDGLVPDPSEAWPAKFDGLLADVKDDTTLTYMSCHRDEDGPTVRLDSLEPADEAAAGAVVLRQMNFHTVSSVRGLADQHTEGALYVGTVSRIAAREFDRMEDAAKRDCAKLPRLVRPTVYGTPIVPGPVERYEVYDIDTGDMLVMWRVPYKPQEEDTAAHSQPEDEAEDAVLLEDQTRH